MATIWVALMVMSVVLYVLFKAQDAEIEDLKKRVRCLEQLHLASGGKPLFE